MPTVQLYLFYLLSVSAYCPLSRSTDKWLPHEFTTCLTLARPQKYNTHRHTGGCGGLDSPLNPITSFMVQAPSGRAGGNRSSNAIKMHERAWTDLITKLRAPQQLIRPSSRQWLNFSSGQQIDEAVEGTGWDLCQSCRLTLDLADQNGNVLPVYHIATPSVKEFALQASCTRAQMNTIIQSLLLIF